MPRAILAVLLTLALGCAGAPETPVVQQTGPRLTQTPFGRTADGQVVDLITLRNARDMEVRLMTYGASIVSLRVPDRTGAVDDVVLGYDTLAPYLTRSAFFGAVAGRYANRIAGGRFVLDGTPIVLARNNGPNHLHGGPAGFDKKVWTSEPFQDARGVGVRMTYTSPDGEEGYPGTLKAAVTYTLTDRSELVVDYDATTDKPTVVNLTQHAYFNLAGTKANDILGHTMTIHADRYVPADQTLIPTGELASVEGTPFDFRTPTAIGARIDAPHEQTQRGRGYDHTMVVTRTGPGLVPAARAVDPMTGRTLAVSTTEPGVQFYTGNALDGTITGKGGRVYGRRAGFCLETQHFPDSPNQPSFPSTVLRPGQTFASQTVFAFGVE